MTALNDNTAGRPPKPAMIKKSTAVLFAVMAFALGLYGGHLSGSLINENEPLVAKQSIRRPAADDSAAPSPADAEKLAALRRAAEAASGTAADWNRLGHWHFERGRTEEALAAYSRSLDLAPGDSVVMTHLGILYRAARQPERALELFRLATKTDPGNETALYYSGIACLDIGDKVGAIEAWQTLQKNNPGFVTPMGPTISQTLEMLKQQ